MILDLEIDLEMVSRWYALFFVCPLDGRFLLMRKNVSGRIYSSATLMNRLHDYYYSTLPYSIFLPFIIHGFRWFRTKKPLIIIIASSSCEVKESSFSCHTYMHSTLACMLCDLIISLKKTCSFLKLKKTNKEDSFYMRQNDKS